MKRIVLFLLCVSVLSFLIAVAGILFFPGGRIMNITSEGFSRASSNLALIGILLGLYVDKK